MGMRLDIPHPKHARGGVDTGELARYLNDHDIGPTMAQVGKIPLFRGEGRGVPDGSERAPVVDTFRYRDSRKAARHRRRNDR